MAEVAPMIMTCCISGAPDQSQPAAAIMAAGSDFNTDVGAGLNINRRAFAIKQQAKGRGDRPPAILPDHFNRHAEHMGKLYASKAQQYAGDGDPDDWVSYGFQQVLHNQLTSMESGELSPAAVYRPSGSG